MGLIFHAGKDNKQITRVTQIILLFVYTNTNYFKLGRVPFGFTKTNNVSEKEEGAVVIEKISARHLQTLSPNKQNQTMARPTPQQCQYGTFYLKNQMTDASKLST